MINSCNGIVFNHQKEWSTDTCYSMDKSWDNCKWNRPVTKDNTVYDSIVKVSGTVQFIGTESISVVTWLLGLGSDWYRVSGYRVYFEGNENVLKSWVFKKTLDCIL